MKFTLYFKLNALNMLSSETQEMTAVLLSQLHIVRHSSVYEPVWFKLALMIGTIELFIIVVLSVSLTLTLLQSLRDVRQKKQKKYLTKFSVALDEIWYTAESCWFDEPPVRFASFDQYSQEKTENKFNVDLHSDIHILASFKLGLVAVTTKVYVFIPVWLTFSQFRLCEKTETFVLIFLQITQLIWMKFSTLLWQVGLLNHKLHLFYMTSIQRRESFVGDDAYDPVFFKIVLWEMMKLCGLMPVLMNFTFFQGHKVMRNVEIVLSICHKLAWSSQNIHCVYVGVSAKKSCKQSKCGLFELLLFWFFKILYTVTRLW